MIKKILIINVNWIGDVLFSTPFIRAVREAHPGAYIACLVHPRCKEVLEGNPRINEIIIYDENGAHKSLAGKLRLVSALRKKGFDAAFLLHRSFTKALIAYLAGIRERIGYATKSRGPLLTKAAREENRDEHKVEYFLGIARAAGIEPPSRSYEFFIKDSHRDFIRKVLDEGGIGNEDLVVVLCPAGNWRPKRWPEANFAKLADALSEKFKAKIVISGTKSDIKLAEEIKKLMKNPPFIACGKTDLKQLGALLERADLVIANDTGAMHMAVAVGAKTIALFGPTSPAITGPYGKGDYKVIFKNESCEVPCYDFTCGHNSCMEAVTVEDVMCEAERMLAQS